MVQRALYAAISPFELRTFGSNESVIFDLKFQVQLLLTRYFDVIKRYRDCIEQYGDILCGNLDEPKDQLFINLHLSTDGGQLYRYKKNHLCPLHATVLDLPFSIRCRPENIMILGLGSGRDKPDWSELLPSYYLHQSLINKKITVTVNDLTIDVTLKIHIMVFDLPAMASVLNHVQYNGKFGCLYCCAPGHTMTVGRGHSRKYGPVCDILSDETYNEYACLSESSNEPIQGNSKRMTRFHDTLIHLSSILMK